MTRITRHACVELINSSRTSQRRTQKLQTNKNNKSKWKTGMGEFKSNGTVKTQDVALQAFATQRKLDMQFSLLPERIMHVISS